MRLFFANPGTKDDSCNQILTFQTPIVGRLIYKQESEGCPREIPYPLSTSSFFSLILLSLVTNISLHVLLVQAEWIV
jgi:hypothetical protein